MSNEKIVIGVLCRAFDKKFTAVMSAAAHILNCELYCFTPDDIDLDNRKIRARVLENDAWLDRECEYPSAIPPIVQIKFIDVKRTEGVLRRSGVFAERDHAGTQRTRAA